MGHVLLQLLKLYPVNKYTENTICKITTNINKCFGKRVLNLVLFGSSLKEKEYGDIDLHLLLDKPKNRDLLEIKEIISKFQSIKIDFLISYKGEFVENRIFRIRNQGRYLLFSLAKGKILLGKSNYYKKILSCQQKKLIIRDLLIKNKEYQNVLRDLLLESESLKKQMNIAKYLLRLISQILIVKNKITYCELLKINKEQLLKKIEKIGLLKQKELILLRRLFFNKESDQSKLILEVTSLLYRLDKINNNLCIKLYDE